MRAVVFAFTIGLTTFAVPIQVLAQSCEACRQFDLLEPDGGSDTFNQVRAELADRPLGRMELNPSVVCDEGSGSPIAEDLLSAVDDLSNRAATVASRSRSCSRNCAPELPEDQYCAYRNQLVATRFRLGAIGLRLSELSDIFERAAQEEMRAIDIVTEDLTLYGGKALLVFKRALDALYTGNPTQIPELEWQASATELTGLFESIGLLADFSLINGDLQQLETALQSANSTLNILKDPLIVSLTRSGTMLTSERISLEERIQAGGSSLAWVMASFEMSARVQTDENKQKLVEEADPRAISACFKRLSISAFSGSQVPGLLEERLNACRSFASCTPETPARPAGDASLLRALLSSMQDGQQRTQALIDSMCRTR